MKKFRLLIIEEHRAVRQALQTRLRSSPTIDVVDAVPRLSDDHTNGHHPHPDVALLSVLRGNDRQLARTLDLVKRLVRTGTAVIVLTSYADEVERELLLQAGASRYLLKDVNTPQLITEIEHVIAEKAKAISPAPAYSLL
jgi:DNA-binding NarL/FixJ family response regulator